MRLPQPSRPGRSARFDSSSSGLLPLFAAIGAALGAGTLCGLWNGLLVVKAGMQPIVATLILMVAGRGLAQLISDGQILTIYYEPYAFLGKGFLLGLPFSLFVVAVIFVALQLLLNRTSLGLFVRAIGENPLASHVAGVRARTITPFLYVFCGFARRPRGTSGQFQCRQCRCEQCRAAVRAGCHPRRRAGWKRR